MPHNKDKIQSLLHILKQEMPKIERYDYVSRWYQYFVCQKDANPMARSIVLVVVDGDDDEKRLELH